MTIEINLARHIIRHMRDGNISTAILLNGLAVDWQLMKDIIIRYDLSPFAFRFFKDNDLNIPDEVMALFEARFYKASLHCELLWQEFLKIRDLFEDKGIPLLPIKGIALLKDIYNDKPLRPLADIDILVQERDFIRAEKILFDLCYSKQLHGLKQDYWRKRHCSVEYCRRINEAAASVDLHWVLDYKRHGQSTLLEIWNRPRYIESDGRHIRVLTPEDTLFSLALHKRRLGGPLSIKNAYDIILLLQKYKSDFDWDYCLSQAKRYHLNAPLYYSLSQAEYLLGEQSYRDIKNRIPILALRGKLIRRFIEENTFARKDAQELNRTYLILHFLLYDNLWEPAEYILNIPQEQFCKYYRLVPYQKKTDLLYKHRLFYIPFRTIHDLIART